MSKQTDSHKILLLSLFLILFSCHKTESINISETIKNEVIAPKKSLALVPKRLNNETIDKGSDTITVSGKSIIFFSISQKEYDKIIKKEGEESGIDEVLDDFNYYASEVADSLKMAGIKPLMTASRTFAIMKNNGRKSYISRDSKKGITGVLLFDGVNEPVLDYGVGTDIDYYSLVNEYFEKENSCT